MQEPHDGSVIVVDGASKSFGAVRALDGVTLTISEGECVGLVGHNGAGKSTLVNIIIGALTPDTGRVRTGGEDLAANYGIGVARQRGVRCVFQELSLCPNLTVTENMRVAHRAFRGLFWRTAAEKLIRDKLDEIFPGHSIDCRRALGELSIAERQMVEIASAFASTESEVRLVILDEPTSSLDATLSRQLLDFIRHFVATGGSVLFISHILGEILEAADRIVVMKDGAVAAEKPAKQFTAASLVQAMGSVVKARADRRAARDIAGRAPAIADRAGGDEVELKAYPGEIVGLAGLGGHGQTRRLVSLYLANSGDWINDRAQRVAFIAGDRGVDGVFPLWSIMRNLAIALLPGISPRTFVSEQSERQAAEDWRERIGIRTGNLLNPILSLSGGNQQKVLFARALATPARVVLMDDPMRGVDIGTKQDVYAMLRQEADAGRTFVWYSTETDEVCQCDRVYVFRNGRIAAELSGEDVNETRILETSFEGAA